MKDEVVVKRGRGKDMQRDCKFFDYFYIMVDYQMYNLRLAGWTLGLDVHTDSKGDYVEINSKVYYLRYL